MLQYFIFKILVLKHLYYEIWLLNKEVLNSYYYSFEIQFTKLIFAIFMKINR